MPVELALPLAFGVHPHAHHVVGRTGLLLFVQFSRGAGEVHGRDDAFLLVVARATTERDGGFRPVLELRPHLVGEAQQQPNHHRRQRRCEIADDLGATLVDHGVDERINRGPHLVLPLGHRPWREPTRDQVPALLVMRIVEADDGLVGANVGAVTMLRVAVDKGRFVLLDGHDVVVAADAPEVVDLVTVHRVVLAQPRVSRVGVVHVEVTVEDVERSRINRRDRHGDDVSRGDTRPYCR